MGKGGIFTHPVTTINTVTKVFREMSIYMPADLLFPQIRIYNYPGGQLLLTLRPELGYG
jgi:hypothetical protein